ncbi:MAG TPA: hypothetical protein K8V56_07025 [Sporosarcina psychrophila]|uniref:Uncharacterized protein n=1 Tax=Sporosarcina psychrophila TaxID=1476 RepID=A0A921G0J2_SPOPS|nr:hypothetical protein [Sporosarcina psychrophila]
MTNLSPPLKKCGRRRLDAADIRRIVLAAYFAAWASRLMTEHLTPRTGQPRKVEAPGQRRQA